MCPCGSAASKALYEPKCENKYNPGMNIFQRMASLYGNESRSWSEGSVRSDTSFPLLGPPPPPEDDESEVFGYSGSLEHNSESTDSLSWRGGRYFSLSWGYSDVASCSWSGEGLQWDVDYHG